MWRRKASRPSRPNNMPSPDTEKIAREIISSGIKEITAFVDSRQAAVLLAKVAPALRLKGIGVRPVYSDRGLKKFTGIEGEIFSPGKDQSVKVMSAVIAEFAKSYREWYLLGGKDQTVMDGYSLGFIHELDAYGIFRDAIRKVENAGEYIRAKKPGFLLTFFGNEELPGIEGLISGNTGVKVYNQPLDAPGRIMSLYINARLGLFGWLVRVIAAKRSSLFDGGAFSGRERYLFVYTGDSTSSIDTIAAVAPKVEGETIHLAEGLKTVKALKKRNVISSLYEDYISYLDVFQILGKARKFLNSWLGALDSMRDSGRFEYRGVNIFPMVSDELDKVIRKAAYNTPGRLLALERINKKSRIGALLVATDFHPVSREAVLFCRENEIPSLQVIHGLVSMPIQFIPVTADKTLVWGEYMRDWFVRYGTPAERIEITGQPRYDVFSDLEGRREGIRKELGIPAGSQVVMYASCRIPGEEKVVTAVLDALEGRKDTVFVVKPHPGEKIAAYSAILKERPGIRGMVVSDKNILDMLAVCDIVLLVFSGVGLEAVLMGKPLIITAEGVDWDKGRFVDDGVAVRAVSADEIRAAIDGLLSGSPDFDFIEANRKKFIYSHNYLNDGNAAARVAGLLKKAADLKEAS
jgi:hypothetical protein